MTDSGAIMVTGATGGIGRALIRALYARGETPIIAACRTPGRLDTLTDGLKREFPGSGSEIIPHRLDLASFGDVSRSAADLVRSGIRLRALINNAGTMPLRHHVTADGHEEATQVNYLSTVLLTRLLLPVIGDGATIVFTVSVTRRLASPRPDFDAAALAAHGRLSHFMNYARSKSLLAHYALHLSRQLASRGISVCCSDPGVVDSGIITLGIPAIDRAADLLFRPLISTPLQGASPALRALSAPVNGAVFTQKHTRMLPQAWADDDTHRATITHTDSILSELISHI